MTRRPSIVDGRGRVVGLTTAGRHLVDELFPVHLANEAAILSTLSDEQRGQLGRLLGALSAGVERAGSP